MQDTTQVPTAGSGEEEDGRGLRDKAGMPIAGTQGRVRAGDVICQVNGAAGSTWMREVQGRLQGNAVAGNCPSSTRWRATGTTGIPKAHENKVAPLRRLIARMGY